MQVQKEQALEAKTLEAKAPLEGDDTLDKESDGMILQVTSDRNEKNAQKEQAIETNAPAEGDVKDNNASRERSLEAIAPAEGDEKDSTPTRDADKEKLDKNAACCHQNAADLKSRQQIRPVAAISRDWPLLDGPCVVDGCRFTLEWLGELRCTVECWRCDARVKSVGLCDGCNMFVCSSCFEPAKEEHG